MPRLLWPARFALWPVLVLLSSCLGGRSRPVDGSSSQPDSSVSVDLSRAQDRLGDTGASLIEWTLLFQDQEASPGDAFFDLWIRDEQHLVAVGSSARIAWRDGAGWQVLTRTEGITLNGVWGASTPSSPADPLPFLVAVGGSPAGPVLLVYSERRWEQYPSQEIPSPIGPFTSVWGYDNVTLITGQGRFWQATWDGTTASFRSASGAGCPANAPLTPSTLHAVDGSGAANHLLAGSRGLYVLPAADGWMPYCALDNIDFTAVFSVPGSRSFLLGSSFLGLYYLKDGPDRLAVLHQDLTLAAQGSSIHGIWGASWNRALAVGDAGTILYFNGEKVIRVRAPTSGALYAVKGLASGAVYICGEGNRIWRGSLP